MKTLMMINLFLLGFPMAVLNKFLPQVTSNNCSRSFKRKKKRFDETMTEDLFQMLHIDRQILTGRSKDGSERLHTEKLLDDKEPVVRWYGSDHQWVFHNIRLVLQSMWISHGMLSKQLILSWKNKRRGWMQ